MPKRVLLIALAVYVTCAAGAFADRSDDAWWAVVEIPSHGLSGTIIHTEGPREGWPRGRTLILTAAHAGDFNKPPRVGMPTVSGAGAPIKCSPRWAAWDTNADLAIAELQYGPVPHVVRIAPNGFTPSGAAWMYGYGAKSDSDRPYSATGRPGEKVAAQIAGNEGTRYEVRPAPIPGRSGGGLVDRPSGFLVGVCSTRELDRFQRPTGVRGWFVSLAAIHRFMEGPGGNAISGNAPRETPRQPRPLQFLTPSCPGGMCPPRH